MDSVNCEPFSGQKCTKLQDLAYKISKFFRSDTPDPISAPTPNTPRAPLLGTIHQFPLGSPAFPLFLFYETTTATLYIFRIVLILLFQPFSVTVKIFRNVCREILQTLFRHESTDLVVERRQFVPRPSRLQRVLAKERHLLRFRRRCASYPSDSQRYCRQ